MAQPETIRPTVTPPEMELIDEAIATCYQCGTCSATCPTAFAMDYSPRALWRLVELGQRDIVLNSNTFWMCSQCYSCTVRCPRDIKITEMMRSLREVFIDQGIAPLQPPLTGMLDAVGSRRNIANEPNETRLIWSDNLPERPAALDKKQAEVLYFVGCVGALFPQTYAVPQSFSQVLNAAGVDYTVLGGEEWCCGYPVYGAGRKERLRELAEHNCAKLAETGAKVLVASCPSCFYTWHHLYPDVLGHDVPVEILHASQYMDRLIKEGRLALGPVPDTVTYHDPCDLGRKSGVYDAPREVIKAIPGLLFNEMPQNGPNSLCCGGGGDIAMYAQEVVADVAQRRMRQALGVEARYIVSSCQQCKRTLAEGGRKAKIRIKPIDLTELVWMSVQSAQAGTTLEAKPAEKARTAKPRKWGEPAPAEVR